MLFSHENELTYTVYSSDERCGDSMDLLLISDENKSHYVCIKDFNSFMCNKARYENKKYFGKCCLQCFSNKEILIEHKENC